MYAQRKGKLHMTHETILFWVIIDPLTFVLGSLGGFVLFHEIVDMDHVPSVKDLIQIGKRRWLAFISLSISIIYFFYRMGSLLQSN
jgi:hypothetical protein